MAFYSSAEIKVKWWACVYHPEKKDVPIHGPKTMLNVRRSKAVTKLSAFITAGFLTSSIIGRLMPLGRI
jgi:hypothetical protein